MSKKKEANWGYLLTLLITTALFTFIIVLVMDIYSEKIPAPRISSSESFNEKARWLRTHIRECDIIIIGSSMAVNNIDAFYIKNTLGRSVINLGSFGLSISEMVVLLNQLPNTCKPKVIITILFRNDFANQWDKTINWDNFTSYIRDEKEYISYLKNMDLSYYLSTFIKRYMHAKKGNNTYESINYDDAGSVMLSSTTFVLDKSRWYAFLKDKPVKDELVDYSLKNLNLINTYAHAHGGALLILKASMTMDSNIFYQNVDEKLWQKTLDFSTKNNIAYYDTNTNLRLTDNDFVDFVHLNEKGARSVSKMLIPLLHTE